MRTSPLFLATALCACATAGPSPGAAPSASSRLAPALADIDLSLARGEGAELHDRLAAAAAGAPSDPDAAFLAAYSTPEREDAWKALKARSDHHPDEALPYLGEALILASWQTWDQAERVAEKAAARAPEDVLVKTVQARVLASRQKWSEARPILEDVLRLDPTFAPAHAGMGGVLLAAGDRQGARREFSAAVAAEPRDLTSTLALAGVCADLGDDACTLAQLEAAARLTPADHPLQVRLGQARQKAGDEAGAARAYLAGNVIEEGSEGLLLSAATAFQATGDKEHELSALVRLDHLQPRQVDILRRIAALRLASGSGDAGKAYAALLRVVPHDPQANMVVAQDSEKRGDLVQAAMAYRRALAGGAQEAATNGKALEARVLVSHPAIDGKGSVARVAGQTLEVVARLARQLRKESPALAGKVVARVSVGKDGKASEVSLLENTSKNAVVAACVYLNLLDASYPRSEAEYRLEIPIK